MKKARFIYFISLVMDNGLFSSDEIAYTLKDAKRKLKRFKNAVERLSNKDYKKTHSIEFFIDRKHINGGCEHENIYYKKAK